MSTATAQYAATQIAPTQFGQTPIYFAPQGATSITQTGQPAAYMPQPQVIYLTAAPAQPT